MPGTWHNQIQNKFPKDKCEITVRNRRADVICEKTPIEIQHSRIDEKEVKGRNKDWENYGFSTPIWMIDGNDCESEILTNMNTRITFRDEWKYKAFIRMAALLLVIGNNVYKIDPTAVKKNVIEVKRSIPLEDVIITLTLVPNEVYDLWGSDNTVKPTITVKQYGAGNGKTYGIWKAIVEDGDSNDIVIGTKISAACEVIFNELKDQIDRSEQHILENCQEIDTTDVKVKHYHITFRNKRTGRYINISIGTVDSFTYSVDGKPDHAVKVFRTIANNISNGSTKKISKSGIIRFGGKDKKLNRSTKIYIDEAQDLEVCYFGAYREIQRVTGCDLIFIGDMGQSLGSPNNCMSHILTRKSPRTYEYPMLTLTIEEPKNINRRAKSKGLIEMINMFNKNPFGKYNLPEVTSSETELEDPPVIAFDPKYNGKAWIPIEEPSNVFDNEEGVSDFINNLYNHFCFEVNTYDRAPEDFLFCSMFVTGPTGSMLNELGSKIQCFFQEKMKDPNYLPNHKYWGGRDISEIKEKNYQHPEYVVFHKSEGGQSINTKDSVNATRITSIVTAKGDGRDVVFSLGMTEDNINAKKAKCGELVGISYMHVASTRAKIRQYWGVSDKYDRIRRDMENQTGIFESPPEILKVIPTPFIVEYMKKFALYAINRSDENIVPEYKDNTRKEIVDWNHHVIRDRAKRSRCTIGIVDKFKNENNSNFFDLDRSPLNRAVDAFSNRYTHDKFWAVAGGCLKDIQIVGNDDWWKYVRTLKRDTPLQKILFPSLGTKNERDKIIRAMETIKRRIDERKLIKLTVPESIVFEYLLEHHKNGQWAHFAPLELINITNYFEKNVNKEKELYNKLKEYDHIIKEYLDKVPNDTLWAAKKTMKFGGENEDFTLKMDFTNLGHNIGTTYHIFNTPEISEITIVDITSKIILERVFLQNPNHGKDKHKYKDKNIQTTIFDLNNGQSCDFPYHCDEKEVKTELKNAMKSYFESQNEFLYEWFKNHEQKKLKKIIRDLKKSDCFKSYPQYIRTFIAIKEDSKERLTMDFLGELNNRLDNDISGFLGLYDESDDESD